MLILHIIGKAKGITAHKYKCGKSEACVRNDPRFTAKSFMHCACVLTSFTNLSHMYRIFTFNLSFQETAFSFKTVLTRIISIVRVPSLYPNKDNPINRDDDAKRSPLSAKHVDDFAFTASGHWRLMTVPLPPLAGIRRRWSHSERLTFAVEVVRMNTLLKSIFP